MGAFDDVIQGIIKERDELRSKNKQQAEEIKELREALNKKVAWRTKRYQKQAKEIKRLKQALKQDK